MVKFVIPTSKNMDVEEIMKNIHENRFTEDYDEQSIKYFDYRQVVDMDMLINLANNMNHSWDISTDVIRNSEYKGLRKINCFIKLMIRKFIRWYLDDIIRQQVEFNVNVVRYNNEVMYNIECMNKKIEELEKKNLKLQEK